jgi:hypothetical protein
MQNPGQDSVQINTPVAHDVVMGLAQQLLVNGDLSTVGLHGRLLGPRILRVIRAPFNSYRAFLKVDVSNLN